MRSLGESRTRWQTTIASTANLDDFKKSVRLEGEGNPCTNGLRSTFLLFQNTEITSWPRSLEDSRSAYSSLREHFLRFIDHPDELGSSLDPLDDDEHSPWNTLRKDEEIRAEIFQDIERCMPEEPFFRQPHIQRIMLDALFIFCKINQDVGYRQGMHEILAPILWVIEQDAIEPKDSSTATANIGDEDSDLIINQLLDQKFIEHDAFTLFSLVMRSAKSFYELGEPEGKRAANGRGTSQEKLSPIVERSKRIHEEYLACLDPELAKHLTDIEILPQVFLIRWIRLLFGREFPFEDLLTVWDTLFAEDPELDLVDLICVAMLLRIRWECMCNSPQVFNGYTKLNSSVRVKLFICTHYDCPKSPRAFVDDATYLRENFNLAGGSQIISKYSGKAPQRSKSTSPPNTPLTVNPGPRQKFARNRSSLTSPARFLQQQGGVEALINGAAGAAKGVYNRGERLGINQAVRDAMEEVKKNMQGLQTPRNTHSPRRAIGATRWSLDDGRVVPASTAIMATMNERNRQLAAMLDHAMKDLRAASVSEESDREKYIEAMDIAIAKVEFVKVYLEDSTMPLPAPSPVSDAEPEPQVPEPETSKALLSPSPGLAQSASPVPPSPHSVDENIAPIIADGLAVVPSTNPAASQTVTEIIETPPTKSSPEADSHNEGDKLTTLLRPRAPIPTRSTIAQSSFSWMLEPDLPSLVTTKSSPPKSSSPFLKSGKRPNSGAGRDKAAFLFGEDDDDFQLPLPRSPDAEEAFRLNILKKLKEKEKLLDEQPKNSDEAT
ncbi:WD repeat domain-containing protein [Rutstroemia sp. NJR-2017a WRK4]|nr:WD repeat domain-containing protein [Rutstroemia sp. NJR-2017a WRK4]